MVLNNLSTPMGVLQEAQEFFRVDTRRASSEPSGGALQDGLSPHQLLESHNMGSLSVNHKRSILLPRNQRLPLRPHHSPSISNRPRWVNLVPFNCCDTRPLLQRPPTEMACQESTGDSKETDLAERSTTASTSRGSSPSERNSPPERPSNTTTSLSADATLSTPP